MYSCYRRILLPLCGLWPRYVMYCPSGSKLWPLRIGSMQMNACSVGYRVAAGLFAITSAASARHESTSFESNDSNRQIRLYLDSSCFISISLRAVSENLP